MKKITYKYTLNSKVLNKIALPKDAIVIGCLLQNDTVVIYALVDNDIKDIEIRSFKVYATGEVINEDVKQFIGTFVVCEYLVFHVYELHTISDGFKI
jgi:hypothetical protein